LGYDTATTYGRAFIIHKQAGGRIGCVLLGGSNPNMGVKGLVGVSATADELVLSGTLFGLSGPRVFSASYNGNDDKYPGTSSSSIYGVVGVTATPQSLSITGTLYGLETSQSAQTDKGNSLGVHVHEGTTCDDADLVGGHYYGSSASSDPWTTVHYTTDSDGVSNFDLTITAAQLGADPSSVLGRAFIVHNADGARVACALLTSAVSVGSVGTYPGYTGSISSTIKGTISYTYTDSEVTVVGALSGVEQSQTAGAAQNSMGVHIHSGSSCSDGDLVGGHYFGGASDPWTDVVYTSTDKSTAYFEVTVSAADLGYDTATTYGRAFIIHKQDGGRIGCVQLARPASNSLGVHVHAGSTCDESTGFATALGHYYGGSTDPWTYISYQPDASGATSFEIRLTKDELGVDPDTVANRAVVVHNYEGDRVACALLYPTGGHGTIAKYVGSASDNTIAGTLSYSYDNNFLVVHGVVAGVEYPQTADANTPNSMGIHVHSGRSCEDSDGDGAIGDDVGGHYYGGDQDPWKSVSYETLRGDNGAATFTVVMDKESLGLNPSSIANRAFVVHNQAGGRIGCSVLESEVQPVSFSQYGTMTCGSCDLFGWGSTIDLVAGDDGKKIELTGDADSLFFKFELQTNACIDHAEQLHLEFFKTGEALCEKKPDAPDGTDCDKSKDECTGFCRYRIPCTDRVDTSALFDVTPGTTAISDGKASTDFQIGVTTGELESFNSIYQGPKDTDSNVAKLEFCVRPVVNAGLTGVLFRDLVLEVGIDLSADIPSFDVQVDSFLDNAVQDVDTSSVTIEAIAFKCKEGENNQYVLDTSATVPNSVLEVCVVGKNAGIECKDIETLVLTQDGDEDKRVDNFVPSLFSQVVSAQYDGVHEPGVTRTSKACLFQTRMDASYFVDVDPSPVQVSGKALMDFAGSRRQLRDVRQLQESNPQTTGQTSDFEMTIRLDNGQTRSFNQEVDSAGIAGQCVAVVATATAVSML